MENKDEVKLESTVHSTFQIKNNTKYTSKVKFCAGLCASSDDLGVYFINNLILLLVRSKP